MVQEELLAEGVALHGIRTILSRLKPGSNFLHCLRYFRKSPGLCNGLSFVGKNTGAVTYTENFLGIYYFRIGNLPQCHYLLSASKKWKLNCAQPKLQSRCGALQLL